MKDYQVKRTAYQKLPQAQLLLFAQNVVQLTFENPTYQQIAAEVTRLKETTAEYELSLVACKDGGKSTTVAKNILKDKVLECLNEVSKGMDYFGGSNLNYYTKGGMVVKEYSHFKSFERQLPSIPINPVVKPTTVRGCIEIEVEVPNFEHVVNIAAEWSDDGGVTWHNGNYFTPSKGKTKSFAKGVMKNLTSFKEVMVRFRAIGKHDMKSEWTNVLVVPVL